MTLVLVVAVTACSPEPVDPPSIPDLLSVMREERTDEDELPPDIVANSAILPDSSRFVGEVNQASIWVGAGSEGVVCLTVRGEGEVWASSCIRPEDLRRVGLYLGSSGQNWMMETFLFPDDFLSAGELAAAVEAGAHVLGGNVIVFFGFDRPEGMFSPPAPPRP